MNPLPSLALLTADIDHEHIMVAKGEDRLRDANSSCTSVDDVLLVWNVRGVE